MNTESFYKQEKRPYSLNTESVYKQEKQQNPLNTESKHFRDRHTHRQLLLYISKHFGVIQTTPIIYKSSRSSPLPPSHLHLNKEYGGQLADADTDFEYDVDLEHIGSSFECQQSGSKPKAK